MVEVEVEIDADIEGEYAGKGVDEDAGKDSNSSEEVCRSKDKVVRGG